ncbi:MAG: cation diffusion facilitator family transporter [Pseudopedobacter saltans]|uniref:Cation diffusion facilitator family transporter n=1 Tax=Pseudopedobacter saltans TaxID=151895 RepID=A0A2W5EY27_9SPHI|nr:MAG: cation diffusion facilitator family transporter [Pseudopedobacter saltans]
MNTEQENYKIQKWICSLSVLLFIVKLVAWYITRSVSILADALESIVNVAAGFIGLYSLFIAAKPKDVDHPYGHGKAEFISAGVEGLMILIAGGLILYNALKDFSVHTPVTHLDNGLYLVAFTAIVNYVLGLYCVRKGRRNNSLAIEASGKHLMIDTYSTIAVIVGLLVILFTKQYWLDRVIAIFLGLLIIYNGYKILRRSLAGIMDEADLSVLKEIIQIMEDHRVANWIDIHNLKVVKYGSRLHIDGHLTVPYFLTVEEAHEEVSNLQKIVGETFPSQIEFNMHLDPCREWSCTICTKTDCTVRKKAFVKRLPWNVKDVLSPKQHSA